MWNNIFILYNFATKNVGGTKEAVVFLRGNILF